MDTAPDTTPDQDIDADEDESSWSTFGYAILCLAIAVVPFTPVWEMVADPDSTRRRYGAVSRFLDAVGPVPVALTFGAIGLLLLAGAVAQVRRNRAGADEPIEGSEV